MDLSASLYHGALLSVHTSNSGGPGPKIFAWTPNIPRLLSIPCVTVKKQCRGIASISAIASFTFSPIINSQLILHYMLFEIYTASLNKSRNCTFNPGPVRVEIVIDEAAMGQPVIRSPQESSHNQYPTFIFISETCDTRNDVRWGSQSDVAGD